MKTFIADIIPRLQKYSQKLDNLTLLTNQHWVVVDEITSSKTVYIFRPNNDLLISRNGKVDKAKWEYLGNNTLLIDLKDESYLFRHGFFDENILALKIDGKNEYAFLVNETRYDRELNSPDLIIGFLEKKYISPNIKEQLTSAVGVDSEFLNEVVFSKPNKTPEELADEERKRIADKKIGNLIIIIIVTILIGLSVFIGMAYLTGIFK